MMDWSYPTTEMLAQDPSGIGVVLDRLAEEAGDPPIRGTRFLSTASEMLEITREVEAAMREGDRLMVGFQTFDRFRREIPTYQRLVQRGVRVTAFAQMPAVDDAQRGKPRDLFGMRWVEIAPHRRHLENQWLLVSDGSEQIAFVGYDISAPEHIAEGGISSGSRRFTGFVSDDPRVVASLLKHLEDVAATQEPTAVSGTVVEVAREHGVRMIMCATDESDPAYRRAREAATQLAHSVDASLLLYDRSSESFLSDPYPYPEVVGPDDVLSRLDAFRLGRSYLADQIDEAVAAGVTTGAWLPMTPGPKGLTEGVERFRPDLIVMPATLARPSLIDRVRGNTLARFRASTTVPVWTVDDDGSIVVSAQDQTLPA